MATFKAVILKGKNDIKGDGTSNIKIRITHQRKTKHLSTDLFISPSHFNNKEGLMKYGKHKNFVNVRLTELLHKYRLSALKIDEHINSMLINELREYLFKGETKNYQIDFFDFIREFASNVEVEATKSQYLQTLSSLRKFVGDKLPVSEINLNFLNSYAAFLRSNGVKNGVINYMRTFRSLFNKCRDRYNEEEMDKILIPQYPFRKYKIPKRGSKTRDHILTVEEIIKLKKHKSLNDREKYARDIFMLMFYLIGIEGKDLYYLGKPRNGRIYYDRFKKGKEFSIRLEPEALEIIKRYKGKKMLLNASEKFKDHRIFFRFINHNISGNKPRNVHGILTRLNIQKNVTTKWARHTWATIARNSCRIDKSDVALCLGWGVKYTA